MSLIPKLKMGEFSLIDTMVITASKIIVERLATPVVGNGTLMSGLAKGAGALGLGALSKGKYPKMVATGIAVDAAEDILRGVNPFGLFGSAAGAEVETGVIRI